MTEEADKNSFTGGFFDESEENIAKINEPTGKIDQELRKARNSGSLRLLLRLKKYCLKQARRNCELLNSHFNLKLVQFAKKEAYFNNRSFFNQPL